MMVMTAKVDLKRILIVVGIVAALILGCILIFGGSGKDSSAAAAPSVSDNATRVQFLKDMGWEVAASPTQSGQVRIPQEQSDAFARYNDLQKSQGYDLSQYAGKTVMRYVYKVTNYPGATDPVFATVLVHKNQIIGGDITDTAARGVIRGFRQAAAPQETDEIE